MGLYPQPEHDPYPHIEQEVADVASQSKSPVAAQAELDQRKAGPEGEGDKALKQQAREQKKAQSGQLAGGKAKGEAAKAAAADKKAARQGNVAKLRDGGTGPVGGRVDNMSRRDDTDVDQGHFCYIDYSNSEAKKAVADQLAPKGSALAAQGFEPGLGSADYGVYLAPGSTDENDYPVTAIVLLRDEHSAQVVVPYDAIKPAPQGGRR
jgi:hypothetical protein